MFGSCTAKTLISTGAVDSGATDDSAAGCDADALELGSVVFSFFEHAASTTLNANMKTNKLTTLFLNFFAPFSNLWNDCFRFHCMFDRYISITPLNPVRSAFNGTDQHPLHEVSLNERIDDEHRQSRDYDQ
jgi:hypothetical protein